MKSLVHFLEVCIGDVGSGNFRVAKECLDTAEVGAVDSRRKRAIIDAY